MFHRHTWGRVSVRAFLLALGAAVCVLSLNSPAAAQTSASISGVVTDAAGAAIRGVRVYALNIESGVARDAVTGPQGFYSVPSLSVGQYRVTFDASGFRSEIRQGITLAAGQQAGLNATLKLGAMKQQITVTEAVPLVSPATQQTAGLVGGAQIKNLPLNGRSYDELLTLNPGIVNYTSEKTGGAGVSNSAVANMFSVYGRRPQENLFLLDGIEYTGTAEINMTPGGTSGEFLGVDAVREFNVLKGTYGAEYGKRPGAQVIIVTQSGSNQVHGTAYEFLRNSALDARNFLDHGAIPPFERSQLGGSLGGPIEKNKTFLFGNYEGFRQRLGLSDVTLVPDANARQGLLPAPNGALSQLGLAPGIAPLFALWPEQNGPELGGGIAEAFSHPVQTIREDFGTTRLDHIFSQKDSLTGVYAVDDSADTTPTSNPNSLDLESLREQVLSLEETHIFSPVWLNTASTGFSRASYFYTGLPTANVPGFVAGDPVGAVVIGGSATPNSPSQITLAGSNIGSHLFTTRNLFTYADTVYNTRGLHQLSGGVWLQRIQANDTLALGQYGQANFASLAAFLQGKIATFSAVAAPTPLGWRSLEGAWFLQDAARLEPNLTLTLGFRDEFTNGWNESSGRGANYIFNSNGVIETSPRIGHSIFTTNNATFLPEPRVAVAWSPFKNSKTAVRAAFGIYASLQDALSYRLDQNAPFNTTLTLKNIPLAALPISPRQALPAGALVSPAGVQPNLQTPMVESYTFALDQELSPNTLLSVSYAGSHAYHEIVSIDANEPTPIVCPAVSCPAGLAPGTTYIPEGAPLANPDLANTWTWLSEGDSSYNALEADLRHRFSHGLAFRGAYTWSKSLDNGDTLNGSAAANAPTTVMNPFNLRADWGLSTFDVRNAVVINASYDLPLGVGKPFLRGLTGWQGKLTGGWTLNVIMDFQSGFPFTPELSFNPSNNGDTRNPDRPSWNPVFRGAAILGSPNRYFNPLAFIVPVNGTYGNVGRDVLIGPEMKTVDFSLTKDTRISEKLSLQFRAEFFNFFNTANFNTPNPIVFTSAAAAPSSTAAVITSTSTTSRQIQFALKLLW
ncbi:MAG: carboxypeptidase regulatory-like domain-containing protein [Terriglobia bacterium]